MEERSLMTINALRLAGKRFERLTVIKRAGKNNFGNIVWRCKCSCGKYCFAVATVLNQGNKKSCGCLLKEIRPKIRKTHGKTRTSIYSRWQGMKDRCLNKRNKEWYRYGGRGIKVCKRWLKFENFLEDMGQAYKKELTLDRINNNKGYSKSNCRWATMQQQNENTRRVKKIKNNLGQVFCSISSAGRKTGISAGNICWNLKKKSAFAGKDKNGNKIYWSYA